MGATPLVDRPALRDCPLLDAGEAGELVRLFKLLSNDTRLRVLHALARAGELCVSDLATQVGMTAQAVSNQLQRFADQRMVAVRREGSRLFYRLADPCLPGLLELGLCLLTETGRLSPPPVARPSGGRRR
jgi:DNA-binding transcriptional ArsR family regulator